MNEKKDIPTIAFGESEVRRLLEDAGPRPAVPADDLAAIKSAARQDWRRMVDDRARDGDGSERRVWRGPWRRAAPLALAATLLVALSVGLWWRGLRTTPGGGQVVATIELAQGAVDAADKALAPGGELVAGAEIATASDQESLLTLRLAGGQSIRLDAATSLRLVDESNLELQRGAVYVDSVVARSLLVRTPFGNVRDIGTQFEVRLGPGPETLRIRVREGAVELARGEASDSAVAGEELTVGADGRLERHAISAWSDEWGWVLAAAPAIDIEDLSLAGYLSWVSRETGWRVRYADEALAGRAEEMGLELGGTRIAGWSPDKSVEVVVPALGLDYRLEEGVLRIQR